MSDVTVEVETEPQAEATAPVVIVDSSPDTGDTQILMDIAERIARIESRVDLLESATTTAEIVSDGAQATADAALSIAIDAADTAGTALDLANEVAEVAVETAEQTGVAEIVAEETVGDIIPDVTPRKPHWLFRSRDDWRREIGGDV